MDVIKASKERPADAMVPRHIPLFFVLDHIAQKIAQTDDRIERRAQLMADARQKQAFGAIGFFRLPFGFRQFADQNRNIGRQHELTDDKANGHGNIVAPERGRGDDNRKGNGRDRRADRKIGHSEAKAIAENDPEIERIEQSCRAIALMDQARQPADVDTDRNDPPQRRDVAVEKNPAENGERGKRVDREA